VLAVKENYPGWEAILRQPVFVKNLCVKSVNIRPLTGVDIG